MRVMLMTVGTGAQVFNAIAKSIDEADPDRLYLFGTEDSRVTVAEVEKRLAAELILPAGAVTFILIADPNEHMLVFEAVGEVSEKERALGLIDRNFVVDYTSGTKAMSVGLALGASAFIPGASFRYVGSQVRDKTYGRVRSGEEDIKVRKSPFYYFAFSEERISLALATGGFFTHAREALDAMLARNPSVKVRPRFEALRSLMTALAAWDNFEYRTAAEAFRILDPSGLERYGVSAEQIEERRKFLNALCDQSAVSEDGSALPSLEMAVDLLENMARRAREGRYADALLRGRRVAEMAAQYFIFVRYGMDTNALDLTLLPVAAKAMLDERKNLFSPIGKDRVKIGFEGTLRLMEALGEVEAAASFRSEAFTSALDEARLSILCYGFQGVRVEKSVLAMRESVIAILRSMEGRLSSTMSLDAAITAARFPVLK